MPNELRVDESTRVADVLRAYPWLPEALAQMDARFKALTSPFAKVMIQRFTVADVSKKFNVPVSFLLEQLENLVKSHNQNA